MASGTGLLNLGEQRWDEEVMKAAGLTGDRLPLISDDPVGGVYPPFGDGACSNIGAGCTTAQRAAVMVGTSGALRVIREDDGTDPRQGLFRYLLDERRIVEGGSLSDGGNLYAWLQPVQAAIEGIAYRFAAILDLMPEVEELVATGPALLADPDFLQILADVLGREIAVSAVPEASLRGAAMLVRREPPGAPQIAGMVRPRLDRTAVYCEARARQQELYEGVP